MSNYTDSDKKADSETERFYETIDSVFGGLTPAQQKAAIYIRKNWEKICMMTAKEVGIKAGVSEATVQRISACLGFRSFMEMKKEMKNNLLKNRAVVKFGLKTNISDSGWLDEHIGSDVANIVQTFHMNSRESFEKGAALIIGARRVYVIGEKMGLGVSSYITFLLQYLLGKASHLNLSNCYEYLSFMSQEDVLIAVGFQRYCKKTLDVLELAGKEGVRIISFTDCSLSPFAKVSDLSFFAQTDSVTFLDSYSSVISLSQALIACTVELDRENIRKNIKNTEKIYHP
ncbi:MurR/RpiR family transcriptional regulator [Lachnospiraceae bacterium 54-53]